MRRALLAAVMGWGLGTSVGCASGGKPGGEDGARADAATQVDASEGDAATRPDAVVDDGSGDAAVDARAADAAVDASRPDATVDAAPPDAAVDAAGADAEVADAVPGSPVLELVAGTDSTQRGNVIGGTAFDDACPVGQVLIGFSGSLASANGAHGQIAARCGRLAVVAAGADWVIEVGPGEVLPTRGRDAASPWTRECPANQMLVGFGGRAGRLIDQLAFRCAPLAITAQGADWVVTVGASTDLLSIGGNGGSAFAQTDCASGQVARTARLRAGDSLDAIGFGCVTVTAR